MRHFDKVTYDTCESANKRRIQLYADVWYHDGIEYFMHEYQYNKNTGSEHLERAFKARIEKGGYHVPCGSPTRRAVRLP